MISSRSHQMYMIKNLLKIKYSIDKFYHKNNKLPSSTSARCESKSQYIVINAK